MHVQTMFHHWTVMLFSECLVIVLLVIKLLKEYCLMLYYFVAMYHFDNNNYVIASLCINFNKIICCYKSLKTFLMLWGKQEESEKLAASGNWTQGS